MLSQRVVNLLKRVPFLYGLLFWLYLNTVLRLRQSPRFVREKFWKALRGTVGIVAKQKLRDGLITSEGEFFLRMPNDIYVLYNFRDRDKVMGDGQSLDLIPDDHVDRMWQILDILLEDGMCYIDVGANNGYSYALRVARKSSENRVIAFEPNPMILHHLERNVAFNQLNNIIIEPIALAEKSGEAKLAAHLGASSYLSTQTSPRPNLMTVKSQSLDGYLEEKSISKVDLIKVDIEGGEYGFLLGAQKLLRSHQAILFLEFKERWLARSGSSQREVLDLLEANDYVVHQIVGQEDILCVPSKLAGWLAGVEAAWLVPLSAAMIAESE